MGCISMVFGPLGYMVAHPFVAFIPALMFLAYYALRRPAAAERNVPGQVRWSLVAGLLWTGYALYELAMSHWSQTVNAPIRIDLFLIWPLLLVITAGAIGACITFETARDRGLEPIKPIRPGPYALTRNRRFVITFAGILVSFALLKFLALQGMSGGFGVRGVPSFLVMSALAVFLVRGYRWARLCLLLWFMYGIFHHAIGSASLLGVSRQDMAFFRLYNLTSLVGYVVLGMYLLVSRRLRDHLDVHSFPETTSISSHR